MTLDTLLSLKCYIFGYFGFHNFGDDSIGLAILQGLSKSIPPTNLTLTPKEDYLLSKNFTRNLEKLNFNFLSILRAIRKSDIFMIAGGTHFQDEDSKKSRRIFILMFFTLITVYAKMFKSQIVIFGHGIGPINYNWSRFIVKFILKNSKFILVRDEDSFNFVKSLGFSDKCFKGFDVAIGLLEDFKNDNEAIKDYDNEEHILGVSLLPFHEIYYNNPQKDDHLLNEIYKSLKRVLEENKNLKIKLFAFRSGNKHSDEEILGKLKNRFLEDSHNLGCVNVETVVYDGDIMKFISDLSQCSSFLGMRYHSILFAYCLNKPFIALDYMKKCKSLTRDVNIADKAVISLEDIDSFKLYYNLNEMLSVPDKYRAKKPVEDFKKLNRNGYEEFYKFLV